MLIEHQHPHNRQITASVLGVPNAGKSTLINHLIGIDLSAVSSKPQTTRNKYHCVFNVERTEIVLVDTPGIHSSNQEINKRMNEQAVHGADGADVNLIMVDITGEMLKQVGSLAKHFDKELRECWLVFTKADLIKDSDKLPLDDVFKAAKELLPSLTKYFLISTKEKRGVDELTKALCDKAPNAPHLYPDGDISNRNERFFVTEYIREQAFHLLKDEVPHELAVVIDEYQDFSEKDKSNLTSHISASILVNRPSQRAIVIGSKGSMIKEIGTRARAKIEDLVGGKIHLNLHVKVTPKWFKNNFILEELGLPRAQNSNRVWHKR